MAEETKGGGSTTSYYLMKAEPDSRLVKGKDVKFSVDDFETTGSTAWEGVRNYEARNLMQCMKVGDKVLFYHSNTKNPGVAGFAEVTKEAYPDYTAWDETHPYYDAKSDASSPKWYMVDLRFVSRVTYFVSLALLRYLSALAKPPTEMNYLNDNDMKAIRNMDLLNKGRLSVQRVEVEAWEAVNKISRAGDGGIHFKGSKKGSRENKSETEGEKKKEEIDGTDQVKGKRKAKSNGTEGTRRSKRTKR